MEAIFKALSTFDGHVINNHCPGEVWTKYEYFYMAEGGLCPIASNTFQSINPIYLDSNGRPHLSTCSVGTLYREKVSELINTGTILNFKDLKLEKII